MTIRFKPMKNGEKIMNMPIEIASTCPKCGSPHIRKQYKREDSSSAEHLTCTCGSCAYIWTTAPLQYTENTAIVELLKKFGPDSKIILG